MGFCLLGNIAIGARSALDEHQLDRVLIVDWDVHHGNGTQELFWDDPRVLFVSTHQFPAYPGTGRADEIGGAHARGLTVNFALPRVVLRAAILALKRRAAAGIDRA